MRACPLEEWEAGKVVGDLGDDAADLRLGDDRLSLMLSLPSSLAGFAAPLEARLRATLSPHLEGRKLALVLTSNKGQTPEKELDSARLKGEFKGEPKGEHHLGREKGMSGVKLVLGVASGKGGVGKSTLAVNLAIALAQTQRDDGGRLRVGLLDADLYGPSLVVMLGLDQPPRRDEEGLLIPEERFGIKTLSMGAMIDDKQALVWRGPMIAKALKQMLEGSQWGELDVLLLDMPPGTGDLPLSLAQSAHLDAVLLVATPQRVALYDVQKSLAMFVKLRVAVLGIVENMSTFQCPQCGQESHIFGQGGTQRLARENNIPLLGRLPLAQELQESGDKGKPLMVPLTAPPDKRAQKGDTKTQEVLQEAQSLQAEGIRKTLRAMASSLAQRLQTLDNNE